MVQFIPAKDDWANSFREAGQQTSEAYMNRSDENSLRRALTNLGENPSARQILDVITNTKTYTNQAKQQMLSNYLGAEQFDELKRKAMAQEEIGRERNRISGLKTQGPEDRQAAIDNFLAQGFDQDEAEALTNPHVPDSVKQGISRRIENEIARGLRKKDGAIEQPSQQVPGNQAGRGVDQDNELPLQSEENIATIEQTEKKPKEWPEISAPPETTPAEREKWRDKNQTFNNKLLKETKEKAKSHTNSLIRYNRLTALNNSKKLPQGMGRLVINPETGEPYGVASLLGLVNKETQDFVKTMNDFLVDAKSYFGSRVTNFDVQAFKSRLPTLLNTEEGRRMIVEQMKLMEQLQIVHDTELENGLKHYGRNANYSDILNVVDEKTQKKEEQIIGKINNLDQASSYLDLMANDPKFKDTVLMQSPQGKFKAVPKNKVLDAEKSKGYIRW